jgi:hypothetical protein
MSNQGFVQSRAGQSEKYGYWCSIDGLMVWRCPMFVAFHESLVSLRWVSLHGRRGWTGWRRGSESALVRAHTHTRTHIHTHKQTHVHARTHTCTRNLLSFSLSFTLTPSHTLSLSLSFSFSHTHTHTPNIGSVGGASTPYVHTRASSQPISGAHMASSACNASLTVATKSSGLGKRAVGRECFARIWWRLRADLILGRYMVWC